MFYYYCLRGVSVSRVTRTERGGATLIIAKENGFDDRVNTKLFRDFERGATGGGGGGKFYFLHHDARDGRSIFR